jgi:CelD/BcsL family acetyltransferase involved in cellulose biosynthesis
VSGAEPDLIEVTDDGKVIGLALLGRSFARRLGVVQRHVWLNEAGDPAQDRPYIEYNGLLAARARGAEVTQAFADWLSARSDWDCLRLAGIEPDSPIGRLAFAGRARSHVEHPSYWVDLAAVRETGDYLDLLSRNTRQQIRRAFKAGGGDWRYAAATSPSEANVMLDALIAAARDRHENSAFGEVMFPRFLAALVAQGFDDGSVEMARVTAGERLVGHHLLLIDGDRVLSYQSGFVDPDETLPKPGLTAHAVAVRHHAAAGKSRYCFLAGSDRYKASLGPQCEQLVWRNWERATPALVAENMLRGAKRFAQSFRS